MQSVSNDSFGPLIAYIVPGATALIGASPFSPTLQEWFATTSATSPTIGGFLYITVASLAVGMTLSAFRWFIIDTLHGLTGLPAPVLNFAELGTNVDAYCLLIEIHYRHYQFYANMLIAAAAAYGCYRLRLGGYGVGWVDLGFLVIEGIFFVTSRDTLRKYYARSLQLLSRSTSDV